MSVSLTRVLGFDTNLEQASARPENVNFGWGKTPRLALWMGAYCHNGVFAFGPRPELLFESIRRAARLSSLEFKTQLSAKTSPRRPKTRFRESGFRHDGQAVLYDFPGLYRDGRGQRLEKKFHYGFSYRQPESFEKLILELEEFRQEVKLHYQTTPYGATHRKTTLIFMILGEEQWEELRAKPKLMEILFSIYLKGRNERFALLLCSERASFFPREFMKGGEFTWFLGEENQKFAEDFYQLPIYIKHFGLKHVGVFWNTLQPETLTSFAALIPEREEWFQEKKDVLREQDEAWASYLKSLEKERE